MPTPNTEATNLYELLGVSHDAEPSDIKRAYRKLAIKHHPDKNPDNREGAEAIFKRVSYAYSVLSDPEQRKVYDHLGEDGLKNGAGGSSRAGFRGAVDAEEIFAQFFRGFGSGTFAGSFGGNPFGEFMGGGSSRKPSPRARRIPQAVQVDLECSLEELFQGSMKRMRVSRRVLQLNREASTVLEIFVKPGWKAGTRITFRDEGDEVQPGVCQDIIFVLRQLPHQRFARQGPNLVYHSQISLLEALTGCIITVPHLDGTLLEVPIQDIVTPTYSKIVEGKGMPSRKRPGRFGDLILTFKVVFPTEFTKEQKDDLRKVLSTGPNL